jgi:hypothetical protein
MLIKVLIACLLVVITVVMHAAGSSGLLRALLRTHSLTASGFWHVTRMMIALTVCLIMIHLAEIAVWGLVYFWQGCLPDAETGIYFSGVTYTSVGCDDLVLPKPWRILAPLETMTGILMCGLSTGLFFAVVWRQTSLWLKTRIASETTSDDKQSIRCC